MNDQQSNEAIEFVKSGYAAAAAVCELKNFIPPVCHQIAPPLTDSQNMTSRRSLKVFPIRSFEQVNPQVLEDCVTGLEREPQSWSSYTNNLQSAESVCQIHKLPMNMDRAAEMFGIIASQSFDLNDRMTRLLQAIKLSEKNIETLSEIYAAAQRRATDAVRDALGNAEERVNIVSDRAEHALRAVLDDTFTLREVC